jgi:hypothetical protein
MTAAAKAPLHWGFAEMVKRGGPFGRFIAQLG